MLDRFKSENEVDGDGNPTGGTVRGTGLIIDWQDGPLGRGDDRKEPNGAFVETVLAAAKQRIEFYQTASNGKYACQTNADAINNIHAALQCLEARTRDRETRGVEGEHKV